MKPRKKQRIGLEPEFKADENKKKRTNLRKKEKEGVSETVEELDDCDVEKDIVDEKELDPQEMDIDDGGDSEESEEDDFRDVKSKKRKKQTKDPASFATALSAILSSSLKAHSRSDPILARSKSQTRSLESAKSDYRTRKALAAQRKALRSIGHVEELLTQDAKAIEYERSMRKTAQRGVITLLNAIRASQIKAEQAISETQGQPRAEREGKVKEMSREGFLSLIKSG